PWAPMRATAFGNGGTGNCPLFGRRVSLGRCPYTPQKTAGTRMEPPMSLPTSRALSPAAIAAALPPLDPPGVRPRSHGLLARPWMGLADCQSASMGGTLVLPSRTAPAARGGAAAGRAG